MRTCYVILFFLVSSTLGFGQNPNRPRIVGQDPLTTQEEQAITIRLTDLDVEDRDDFFYPWGFSLTVYSGSNFSVSGNTITPVLNFSGTLSVPVTVSDGKNDSEIYHVRIQVTPVNDPPVITGQQSIATIENTPITIQLGHLTVSDPDNSYPTGFRLTVLSGSNYTLSGNQVTPAAGFIGTLTARVTVTDGMATSPSFSLTIVVNPGNKKPVITGQTPLSMGKNQSLLITLAHLVVEDPDNTYPTDFRLIVMGGNNYTVSGETITPTQNFVGQLSVQVKVNDGKTDSNPYSLNVQVSDALQIIGHTPLETDEDVALPLSLSHLKVTDPENTYPNGFSLIIQPGQYYTAASSTILPDRDFHGNLKVGVVVKKGDKSSAPYEVSIVVKPVNDPPIIENLETEPVKYIIGNTPVQLSKALEITDVDHTELMLAEVGFRPENFRSGEDELVFENTTTIRAVFDPTEGILSLIGKASLADYQNALRSIRYQYTNAEDPIPETKTIYIKLNDGTIVSDLYERQIVMQDDLALDIPNGFTPNDDLANDTWKIKPLKNTDRLSKAIIRVYNKRGALVYEAQGIDKEWDGTLNGEILPPDTYFYTIDLNLSYPTNNYKGVVAILR